MRWVYQEVAVAQEQRDQLMNKLLRQGWELVGLHQKHTRSSIRIVAILRREAEHKR